MGYPNQVFYLTAYKSSTFCFRCSLFNKNLDLTGEVETSFTIAFVARNTLKIDFFWAKQQQVSLVNKQAK